MARPVNQVSLAASILILIVPAIDEVTSLAKLGKG